MTANSNSNTWGWKGSGADEQKAGVSFLLDDIGQRKESHISGKQWIAPNTTSRIFYPPKSSPLPAADLSIPPGFGGDRGSGYPLKVVEGEHVGDLHRLSNENDKDALLANEDETPRERERSQGAGGSMTWASAQRVETDNKSMFLGKIDNTVRREFGFAQLDSTGREVILNDKEFERRVDRYSSSREDLQRKGSAIASQLNSGRDLNSTDKEMEGRIDRYACNREDSQRRSGDTVKESTSVEKEMEGRVDRYASSRDNHSRDGDHGIKTLPSSNFDWRKRDRSAVAHAGSRSPPFFSVNASSQDSGVRKQGAFDISAGTLSSPQVSPYSGASSLALEGGQDEASHLSPPKRPRLGWGQGLAKYEKKKVGDGEDAFKSSSVTKDEAPPKTAPPSEEESPLDRVSISGSWVTASTSSAKALLPEISISDNNLPTLTEGIGPKVEPGLGHDIRLENSLEGGVTTLPEQLSGNHSDSSAGIPTAIHGGVSGSPQLSPSHVSDQIEAPHPNRYLRLTREADGTSGVLTTISNNDESSKSVSLTSGLVDDLSLWTKEAILMRVEKVEGEIDSLEKELAKIARETEVQLPDKVDSSSFDHQGGHSYEVASPTTENAARDQNNAADDPTSACLPSLPSPCMVYSVMVDSTDEKIGEQQGVRPSSTCGESPLSAGAAEQVYNEDLPPLKSSSACSGETDHDGEADVLKEITNGMLQAEEKRQQLLGKDMQQVKHTTTDVVCASGFESRNMMAYQWSLVYSLIQENRKLAKEAAAPFSSLLSKDASYDRPKFYGSPEDAPVWRENVESHLKNQERMQIRLAERRRLLRFKERVLALKHRALKEECQNGQLGMCQRRDRVKAVRRWEVDRRNAAAFALTNQRPALRLRPILASSARTDAAAQDEHVKKKLMAIIPTANHLRQDLKMPSMMIDEKERSFRRFVNQNGLVEDPVSYEQERKALNPWTAEEKNVFLERFTVVNKSFSKIASFLEHKTTADCVEYYYRNQKSEDFERVRRRQQLKKRRDYSVSSASYLATTTPGNNRNHRDVNATRVHALTLAAYAASRDCSKALRGSSHKAAIDKARPAVTTCDSGSLVHMVVKPSCAAKESSRAGSTPDATALSGISPGSLSAGGTLSASTKNFREKLLFAKSGSGFVSPSAAKGIIPEQQHSGSSRGMRSTSTPNCGPSARIDTSEEVIDSQWTEIETELFADAVAKFGKEFKRIADHVGSKTQTQCKTFFSKTRKRFKLNELVEHLIECPHSDLDSPGLDGVAVMKTESIFDEKVEINLGELASVETATGGQGQQSKVLNTAEVNVADGLMLLGQALEPEIAALPSSKFPNLSSTMASPVSRTASPFAPPPPKGSLVPSTVSLVSLMATSVVSPVPSAVPIVPSTVIDLSVSKVSSDVLQLASDVPLEVTTDLPPSEVSDLPENVFDVPSEVLALPAAEVLNVPAKVSENVPLTESQLPPPKVSDSPSSRVSDLPSVVSDMPTSNDGSDFVSKDYSDLPSNVSFEFPSTKPVGDAPTLTIDTEEHEAGEDEEVVPPDKSTTGSILLDEQKCPEQTVKIEQVDNNDSPIIPDGLIKIQRNGTSELSSMKHEPAEALGKSLTMEIRGGESDKDVVGGQLAQSLEKSSQGVFALAHPDDGNFGSVVVKAEPVVPLDTGGASLSSILAPTAQAVSPLIVAAPVSTMHSGQQPRERGSRINAAGEFKPRREPTSWTQEEKEKFAEIIRRHGKDWTLLHENLPAKSLTQIKTYFQNSKAKLGFLPSDGLTSITARGISTRKRKAEESDTSSNAGSTGQIQTNPKAVSLSSEDISQKVISSSLMSLTTNSGTPAVGGDGLGGYAHFNPGGLVKSVGEDSSSVRDIQKLMRRMVAANEYPSQGPIPSALMPLFQPGAFPTPNTQQQPLLLGAQKQQQQVMVGHQAQQQQSLSSQALLQQQQQISQMTPTQRQLLTKVVQQLQQQQLQQQQQQQLQQQQQPPNAVVPQQLAHQLQQQVTEMVAAQQQQQQQQHHLAQVVKHMQPQLLQHHVQQAIPLATAVSHQHQLGSRPKQAVVSQQQQPQVTVHNNRVVHHPSASQQQQTFLHQQQFRQQQKQHLIQQLQQEQLSQQIQFQLQQTQKQIQPPPQLQQLQQLHQQQLLQQLHQFQLHQELNAQQQQIQQQQQKQVQQQVQQQQSLGLFRSPFQSFFSEADLLRQSEMMEQRSTASKLGLLQTREDLQQQQAQQTQRPAQAGLPQQQPVRTMSSSSETEQRLRLGDVKLFGQSLLSQPPPNAGGQASSMSSLEHKLWQPVTAIASTGGPAVAMPTSNMPKIVYGGKDPSLVPSAFARAGVGSIQIPGEGHAAQSWRAAAAASGNLDLWTSMMVGGLQGVVYKNQEEPKSELSSVQDAVARMTARVLTREAHGKDGGENMMGTHQHTLEHVDSGRGGQDLKGKEVVAGDIVRGKDTVEAVQTEQPGQEQRARMEAEWRNDSLQQAMSAGSVEAFTRPSQPKVGGLKSTINQSFEVMDTILASADQRGAQGSGVSTSAQGGGVNDDLVQQILKGMGGIGSLGQAASFQALKKLLSGSDMSQVLRDGYVAQQPNSVQSNWLSNMSKSSWVNSLGPHNAPESQQVISACPSFQQSGTSLRSHIAGQEEHSIPSDSKNRETTSGGNG